MIDLCPLIERYAPPRHYGWCRAVALSNLALRWGSQPTNVKQRCPATFILRRVSNRLGISRYAQHETASTKQFNFARHWRKKIVPLLSDHEVKTLLMFGLIQYDPNYRDGDPPWLCGRGPVNGQRVKEGCLSWYQPWGRCHFIAPFCWALARKLFPRLHWGFVSGDYHTVVIGWTDDWANPLMVMDILLFREKTAQQSLEFAKAKNWRFFSSMAEYAASFCDNPKAAIKIYREVVEASLEVACA